MLPEGGDGVGGDRAPKFKAPQGSTLSLDFADCCACVLKIKYLLSGLKERIVFPRLPLPFLCQVLSARSVRLSDLM